MKKIKVVIVNFLKQLGFVQNSDLPEFGKQFASSKELANVQERITLIEKTLSPEKVKKVLDPNLHEFPEKGLKIRTCKGIDQDSLVFHISKPCWTDGEASIRSKAPFKHIGAFYGHYDKNGLQSVNFSEKDFWKNSKKSYQLVAFIDKIAVLECVAKIESDTAFKIEMTKSGAVSWDEILPRTLEAIASTFPDVEKKEEVEAIEE